MRIALLTIVLVLPIASALPLQARVDDARLAIELGAGLPSSFDVVISHYDGRAWVDRIAHVDRGSAPNATLRIDGLPHEVAFTVRVVSPPSSYPTLAGASSYLDASAVANLPSIAEASVPPIPAGAGDHLVALDVSATKDPNLRWLNVAPDGTLAMTFLHYGSPGSTTFSLAFSLSHDAGHTWTTPRSISAERSNEPLVRTGIDGDGKLVILFDGMTYVPNGASSYFAYEPWHFTRVDPATGQILADRAFAIDGSFFQLNDGALAPGPGKGSTLAWLGGYATLDGNGRELDYRNGSGAHLAILTEDGNAQALPDIPSAPDGSSTIRIAASPVGAMAVVGTGFATVQNISMRGWVSTSPGGPHLFSPAQNVTTGFVPTFDASVGVTSVAVDDSRNVHATFTVSVANQGSTDAYEASIGPDGNGVSAIDLRSATPKTTASTYSPSVVISGRTAWLTWSSDGQDRWLARSSDGGSTWSSPMLLKTSATHDGFDLYGLSGIGILPDGRPAMLGGWAGTSGAALPFDPRPVAAAHLDELYLAPATSDTSTTTTGGALAITAVEPSQIVLSRDGTAPVNVTLHNGADHDITATLSIPEGAARFSFAPGAVTLRAGETSVLAGVLELDPPTQAGGSVTTAIVASADDGTIARSADLRIAWPGAPQLAPEPEHVTPSMVPVPTPFVISTEPPPHPEPPPEPSPPPSPSPVPAPSWILAAGVVAAAAFLRRATFK